MWWASSKRAQLYLGDRIAWCGLPGQATDVFSLGADWRSDVAQHVKAMGPSARHWDVWLGGLRCQLQAVPALQGVQSKSEAETALTQVGEGGQRRSVQRIRLLALDAASQWLIATADAADMDWLAQGLGQPGLRVHHIRPWWCASVVQQRQAHAVAGLAQDPEAWTCWRRSNTGDWEALSMAHPGEDAACERTLKRLQMSGRLPQFRLVQAEVGKVMPASGVSIQADPTGVQA